MRSLLPALLLVCAAADPVAGAQVPAPGAPLLTLSAPTGASVELRTVSSSRLRLEDVQVSGRPGANVTQADLNRLRSSFNSAPAQTTTVSGKAFYRVASRNTDGSAVLLASVVQNVAGQPPLTMRISQTVAPTGEIGGLRVESDDPRLNAVLAGLMPETLEQMMSQNSPALTGIYGRPLVPGTAGEQTVTLDMQGLMGALFSAVAGAGGTGPLSGQLQSAPLSLTTRTTYQGLSAQGLHTFTTRASAQDWQVEVPGTADIPAMTMSLGGLQASGTQTFRRDGLPGASQQRMTLTLRLSTTISGAQVDLTLTLEQRTDATVP